MLLSSNRLPARDTKQAGSEIQAIPELFRVTISHACLAQGYVNLKQCSRLAPVQLEHPSCADTLAELQHAEGFCLVDNLLLSQLSWQRCAR
jgi:hypothetical protein